MTIHYNCSSGHVLEAAPSLGENNGSEPNRPSTHTTELGDDRYPGTFFRVPGVPVPGKTAWNLIK